MPIETDRPASLLTGRTMLRIRPDLLITAQQFGRHRYWMVKDPVALTYFHLREEEHAILKMLDGRTSIEEIKRRFEQAFAPLQMTLDRLQAFLGRLHGCGLVISEAPGQGDRLLERRVRSRRMALGRSATGLLALRFRGIDPEPLLGWLYPRCRWLFSTWFLIVCLLLAASALVLAAVEFDVLQSRLPEFGVFFGAGNVFQLAAVLILAKVLHELGHGLACKHFGGECHEMGLMLLVFTPCLYCNVSDAWTLPNKWHRVAMSAAGICVEIVLAAVCTLLWWASEPGLLNTLALNMMFVCSVSTILFNGNPLLRYDGYYVLADLAEVPNLSQQSKALVSGAMSRWFLGVDIHSDRSLPEDRRGLLAAYGVVSTAYRWAIVVGILWFCHTILKQYRLELVAQAVAVVVIGGLLMWPICNAIQALRNPAFRGRISRGRVGLSSLAALALTTALLLLPLPFRVTASVVLQPEGGRRVYVSVPGTLSNSTAVGTEVQKGDTLGVLSNLDVDVQIEELIGRRNCQQAALGNLRLRLVADPSLGTQIPAAEEALADVQQRLRQRQRDQQRLKLTAPEAGTVLPPAGLAALPYEPGRLQPWQGSPLDECNLGCHLQTGTLFCTVGNPSLLEAVLVIDQSGLTFVEVGQRVRIQLDELPSGIIQGTITEIAKTDLKIAPRELVGGGSLLTRQDDEGRPVPVGASYQARVVLDEHEYRLLTGSRGRAKILADPQPLIERLYRYLKRTFTFV